MRNRSAESAGFEPSVKISRSRFNIPAFSHKTTFNNGQLIPIFSAEVLPGDTFKLDFSYLLRSLTPIKPVMDNMFLDISFFFVPRRLVWSHWREFMGENRNGPWISAIEYPLPHTKAPIPSYTYWYKDGGYDYWFKPIDENIVYNDSDIFDRFVDAQTLYYIAKTSDTSAHVALTLVDNTHLVSLSNNYYILFAGWGKNSLAAYFGFPIGTYGTIDSCYFRSYALIWNEFFRDENYMNFQNLDFTNDSDRQGLYVERTSLVPDPDDAIKGNRPLNVARFHDVFSSVLPQPQFGDPVKIPVSVDPNSDRLFAQPGYGTVFSDFSPINLYSGQSPSSKFTDGKTLVSHYVSPNTVLGGSSVSDSGTHSFLYQDLSVSPRTIGLVGTILDLRNAFQVQKYLERSSRYGSRYIEMILGQFGVINPDFRLQRPECLFRMRNVLKMSMVLQTSSTDSSSPQGNEAGYSLTSSLPIRGFTKSFTEHGIIIGLACTRTSRSYSQGIERRFSRRRKLDFFFPVFDHISEQPIYNKEIFNHYRAPGGVNTDYKYPDEVFGYQEAWYEYRNFRSYNTGDFDPCSPEPLDFWHYGDYYQTEVFMSDDWLFEGPENVDRTLAVSSRVSNQFLAEFAFDITATRPMSLYSIPGLADHF